MGWRFRRSVKIAPGLRLNISKRSLGLSAGPRGAKLSANTRGEVRRTVGLPGTGLSHTTQTRLRRQAADEEHVPIDELTAEEIRYVKSRYLRRLVGWSSFGLIVVLIFAGAATLAGYLIIPAVVATLVAPWFARWL